MVQRTQDVDFSDIRARLSQRAGTRLARDAPPIFSSANLDRHYRPLRGMVCSIVAHSFIVAALIVAPIALGVAEDADLEKEAVILRVDELDDVLYLPLLGNTELDTPELEPMTARESKPGRAKEGLSYPGPQPIFSNPRDATNHTQTLLQPAHANVPILQSFMLPNLVRLAEPARLPPPLVDPRFKALDTSDPMARSTAATTPLDVPLPDTVRRLAPPVAESRFRLPDASIPIAPTLAAVPHLNVPLNGAVAVSAPANPALLALSPTPARADQPIVIPPGEVRGRFAISPEPNLSFDGIEPGTRGDERGSTPPSSTNENSADEPRAPAASKNAGTASSDAFPGITILGGIDGPGVPRSATREPLQTSYGITILSSGGSGGGLKDFGVFGNEQVQTVYLDMRRTINDRPLSWTAEYAVGQREIMPVNGVVNISIRQEVELPFPIT